MYSSLSFIHLVKPAEQFISLGFLVEIDDALHDVCVVPPIQGLEMKPFYTSYHQFNRGGMDSYL
jgi:hypothetical protein